MRHSPSRGARVRAPEWPSGLQNRQRFCEPVRLPSRDRSSSLRTSSAANVPTVALRTVPIANPRACYTWSNGTLDGATPEGSAQRGLPKASRSAACQSTSLTPSIAAFERGLRIVHPYGRCIQDEIFTARNSPLPTGTRQRCEFRVAPHELDEREHFLKVRRCVVHDQ